MPAPAQPQKVATPPGSERRSGALHFSTVQLLIALVLLFVSAPFVGTVKNGEFIESALMTLVLLAAILAVGGRRRTLAFAIFLAVPAIVAKWASHLRADLVSQEYYFAAVAVYLLFVVVNLFLFILRARRVNLDVMCAGIAGYLLLGLLWAIAYLMVTRHDPNSFAFNGATYASSTMDPFTALYFSFVTLTTTGYGDFTPVARVARMLATMEAMTGTFYVAILISRLVALYSSQPHPPETNVPGAS